ncbi:MAG: hypothetical protein QM769_12620 [Pseudoxanthomonas sp.]
MTFRTHALPLAALLGLALAGVAHADTLLVDRVNKPASTVPVRGQTAEQVVARFGEPAQKLNPEGGQKKQWPTINRWVYADFTVYFEKNRVIDVVANRASAEEIGPKPSIR